MNKKINFISSDMAVPAKSLKLVKVLNKLSIVGAVILVLSIIVAISGFIFFTISFKKVDASVASLKNDISSLEKSEQKLILVKDKLNKIAYIRSLPSADNDISEFQKLNEIISVSSDSAFTGVNIGSNKTELSLASKDSTSLSLVLDSISNLKNYVKITLSSLGYNPTSGFLSSLIFESK